MDDDLSDGALAKADQKTSDPDLSADLSSEALAEEEASAKADVTDAIILDSETDEPLDDQSAPKTVSGGEVIINMEGMIKNYIASIAKLQEEVKKQKEMLDDIFDNDPTYKSHTEAAKDAAKIKQQTKSEILKRPQAKELNERIKTMKSEIKEQQGALSDYLQEYQRMSGVNEIEGEDGEVREIVYVAKLVKKSFRL